MWSSSVVATTVLFAPPIWRWPVYHPLEVQTAIPVASLANEPFITTPCEHMMSVCRQGGFTPRVVQQARQFATIVSLVGAGLGVALVPGCMRSVQLPDVAYCPLTDAREHSELAVAFRRAERAPATKALIEQMRGVAKRLKDPRLVEGSEEHTKICMTGIHNDSLSGIDSQGSGANGQYSTSAIPAVSSSA